MAASGIGEAYTAFISYRHADVDRRWAEWLHGALERYSVPSRLRQARALPARIGRVFRDEEELAASSDLSAEIASALERSRFLIVVCSPRTPGSRWVAEEIERFRALGRGRQVLALLVEGEPAESFPEVLQALHGSTAADGSAALEPLAADVRPVAHASERERKRLALLRLLAPLLGLTFDELRQREQERQLRRMALAGTAGLGVLALVSVLAVIAYLQRNEATRQRDAAVRNLARSYSEAGATANAERDVLAAEVAFAKALLAHDEPETRERLLQTRARGFSLRWQVPGTGETARAAVSADGARIALAKAHEVDVRDLRSGERIAALRTEGRPNAVAFDATGAFVAAGDDRGRLSVWKLENGARVADLAAHDTTIDALAFDAASGEWRTAARDNRVKGWKANGAPAWSRAVEGPALSRALFLPGGQEIALGDVAGGVRIEPVRGGAARWSVAAHAMAIGALALSPDGAMLATWAELPRPGAPHDASVKVWALARPQDAPRTLAGDPGAPRPDALAFSPDGRRLLTGQIANGLAVWDLASGQLERRLGGDDGVAFVAAVGEEEAIGAGPGVQRWNLAQATVRTLAVGHGHSAQAIAALPDGRSVVSAGFDRTLRVWDAGTGSPRAVWPEKEAFRDVQSSPDGRWIATCGRQIVLRDATTGVAKWSEPAGFHPFRGCLAFDPEAPLLHVATAGGAVISRSLADGSELDRLALPATGTQPGALAAAAGKLAVAASDRTVVVFDLALRSVIATLQVPGSDGAKAVAISADGRQVAAASRDSVVLWSLAAPDAPRTGRVPSPPEKVLDVQAVAFTRDGLRLLTTAWGELALWDTVALRRLAVLRPRESAGVYLNGVALAPDGRSVAVGFDDGTVASWRIEDAPEARTLRANTGMLLRWSASADGQRLAAIDASPQGGSGNRALLYDLTESGAAHPSAVLEPPIGSFADLAFAPGGRLYAALGTGSEGGQVRGWDLASRSWRPEIAPVGAAPRAIAVSADGRRVAVGLAGEGPGSATRGVMLDAATLRELARNRGHERGIESLRFDAAGSLWSGGLDLRAIEWRADGTSRPLPLHGGTVTAVAVSPDGRHRATASRDGSVRVFDSENRLVHQWYSHRSGYGWAEDVDFSADGRWLASAGGDGRVLLREVGGDWPVRFVLRGHEDPWIQSARFIGQRLVTRSHEGWLKVWNIAEVERVWRAAPKELAAETARRTGRPVAIER
jgi:WD40 repeat protein